MHEFYLVNIHEIMSLFYV